MHVNTIRYRVTPDGYIDHWLVAGPADQELIPEGGALDNVSSSVSSAQPDFLETFTRPVEWEPPLQVGSEVHRWMYRRSLADHRLDLADTHAEPVLRRYWLYAEVLPGHQSELALVVEAAGKVSLWANGREAECLEGGGSSERFRFVLPRHEGTLRLFLELRAFVCGAWPGFLSACLEPHVGSARINLPTTVDPERRLGLEAVIGDFALDRHVYSRTDPITLRWPADYDRTAILGINLRRPGGATYVEVMQTEVKAGTEHVLNMDFTGPDGRYRLTVKPHLQEYYEENQRVESVQDAYVIDHVFEQTPEQEDEDRVQRLLQAAFRHQGHPYRELAVLQRPGEEPDRRLLEDCIRTLSEGSADAETAFLALWQMGRDLEARRDREGLAILDGCWSRYLPSTVIDGVEPHPVRGFLARVCQVLAGLQDPFAVFVGFGGRLGSDLVREGTSLVQAWMLNRLARGFAGCESEVRAELDPAGRAAACGGLRRRGSGEPVPDADGSHSLWCCLRLLPRRVRLGVHRCGHGQRPGCKARCLGTGELTVPGALAIPMSTLKPLWPWPVRAMKSRCGSRSGIVCAGRRMVAGTVRLGKCAGCRRFRWRGGAPGRVAYCRWHAELPAELPGWRTGPQGTGVAGRAGGCRQGAR